MPDIVVANSSSQLHFDCHDLTVIAFDNEPHLADSRPPTMQMATKIEGWRSVNQEDQVVDSGLERPSSDLHADATVGAPVGLVRCGVHQ